MRHVSEAFGNGGRRGSIESVSGSYRHNVRLPGTNSDGVTPEELIAGAWVACFGMTFIDGAKQHEIDANDVRYKARVVLESSNGEYTITEASLDVDAPNIGDELLRTLIDYAHANCPVSKLLGTGVVGLNVQANLVDTNT